MTTRSPSKNATRRPTGSRGPAEARQRGPSAGSRARSDARAGRSSATSPTNARKKVMRVENGFEQHVAEHPFRSVVIAAGIGALLGCALGRRS